MKKFIALTMAALTVLLMAGCTKNKTESIDPTESETSSPAVDSPSTLPTPESGTTPAVSTPLSADSGIVTPTPENRTVTATIKSKNNDYEITETGDGSVTVTGSALPAAGDTVSATVEGNYLKVKASGFSGETIVYLSDGIFTYTYQSNSSVYMPTEFTKSPLKFTFSIPTNEELMAKRNLALNPFDHTVGSKGFPHAESSNVYDASGQFIPRNAIDGFTRNNAHGNYPYQSWGPRATVLASDHFTIDFGREVTIDSIVLYLRADGFGGNNAHDAYFSEITLEFSDGSVMQINPIKTASAQTFDFAAIKTTSIKLTGFVTDTTNSQGWAAITEIQVTGSDVIG